MITSTVNRILKLDWIPCDLNTYIREERSSKFIAALTKKNETEAVIWECKKQQIMPLEGKVAVVCMWYQNGRKDPDNIAFALKFILDGMVKAGVMKNDSQKEISWIEHRFCRSNNDSVTITIYPVVSSYE